MEHAMNTYGGLEVQLLKFLIFVLDREASQLHISATLLLGNKTPEPIEQKVGWAPALRREKTLSDAAPSHYTN
jgi:hypothetical protein